MKRKTTVKGVRPRSHRRAKTRRGKWLSEQEWNHLQERLREAHETLDAIRDGKVDALVVNGPQGERIYCLNGADEPYRVYVERMQEGAVAVSHDGLILYANQRFADMLVRPLEQVISSYASCYLDELARRQIDTVFRNPADVVKFETSLHRLEEPALPVNLSASHFPLQGQNVVCLVVTDLSAQKQNEELRLAKEVAEKANQAKDAFLAALSHELRTPLNPVLMLASEAAVNPDLPPDVRSDFAAICRNIELEAQLIDDLLDLNRITHGKFALSTALVDCHAVLTNAIGTVRSELDAKQIFLSLNLDSQTCLVEADALRLQQVFWNVLKNSIKFTPQHGRIRISSQVSSQSREVLVAITDSGIGLTDDEIRRVFEAFAQGDHTRTRDVQFGGLGLGLSISKMIVKMHAGEIQAYSAGRGKGATFTIKLPIVAVSLEQMARPAEPLPAETKTIGSPERARILLVEDHEPTRDALAQLLQRRRHSVWVAATATEARALAENRSFDLVISDIGLPDDNGFELMKELNERFKLKGIALTGYGSEQDITSSKESGFLRHLTKPVRMECLDMVLAAILSPA
jgi:signal transduction histidine kinase/CheY-like chemotaxis protein